MTRKRYIKLMMASGWDRNEATSFAEQTREDGISYAEDYAAHKRICDRINIDALIDAIGQVADTIHRVSKALCAAVAAFGKVYTEAMSAEGKEASDT